jgi:hypothetical protein
MKQKLEDMSEMMPVYKALLPSPVIFSFLRPLYSSVISPRLFSVSIISLGQVINLAQVKEMWNKDSVRPL